MNKKKILSTLAVVLLLGSILTVSQPAYAFGGWFGGGNFFSKLVEFIAQKFGLDKTQVQTAVNDFQKQQKATITPRPTLSPQDMTAREKTRLDTLVSQGKITADQENLIIAELATLRAKYPVEPGNTQTPDQRKTRITSMQNDFQTWATANGIDPNIYPIGMGRGFGGRRGMMRGQTNNDGTEGTQNQ